MVCVESFPQVCFEGKLLQNLLLADKNELRSLGGRYPWTPKWRFLHCPYLNDDLAFSYWIPIQSPKLKISSLYRFVCFQFVCQLIQVNPETSISNCVLRTFYHNLWFSGLDLGLQDFQNWFWGGTWSLHRGNAVRYLNARIAIFSFVVDNATLRIEFSWEIAKVVGTKKGAPLQVHLNGLCDNLKPGKGWSFQVTG